MADNLYELELEQQEQELAERRALLKARAAQAAQQAGIFKAPTAPDAQPGYDSALVPGFRYVGRELKTSPLAAAVPLLAQARLDSDQSRQREEESAYRTREQAAEASALASFPRDTPAVPGIAPLTPNDDDGNPMPVPRAPVAARQATAQDRLNWAAGPAGKVPSLRDTVKALVVDQIVKEPERQEARAERVATAAAARAEKAERAQADRQLRADINADNISSREFIAQLVKGGGKGGGGSGGGGSSATLNLTDDNGNPVEGWARKGVKPNDIVKDVAGDGTVTLTDKLTGQRLRVGGGGRTSGSFDKDNLDRKELISSANEGLNIIKSIREVLPKASSSVYEAGKGWVARKFNYTTDVDAANSQLETLTGALTSMIPRLPGPVSNADLLFLQQQAADAANPSKTTGQRMTALAHAEARLQRILRNTAPPTNTPAPPTSTGNLRQDVINANRQHSGGWSVEKVN